MLKKLKTWFTSKTIMTLVALLAPLISKEIGFDVLKEGENVYTIIMSLLAIYFRIRTQIKLDFLKELTNKENGNI